MKDFHVRRGAHWIVMSLFLTVAGCGGSPTGNEDNGTGNGTDNGTGTGTDPATGFLVTVDDNFFTPQNAFVSPGATVTWTWVGGSNVEHNVTFAFSSVATPSETKASGTFQVTMPTRAVEYSYFCTIHSGMTGSVFVTAP